MVKCGEITGLVLLVTFNKLAYGKCLVCVTKTWAWNNSKTEAVDTLAEFRCAKVCDLQIGSSPTKDVKEGCVHPMQIYMQMHMQILWGNLSFTYEVHPLAKKLFHEIVAK